MSETYDPPVYTQAEMEAAIERAILRGVAEVYRRLADTPLTVHGNWEPDTVYDSHSLVYHGGYRWLAFAETSAEPGRGGPWWNLTSDPAQP